MNLITQNQATIKPFAKSILADVLSMLPQQDGFFNILNVWPLPQYKAPNFNMGLDAYQTMVAIGHQGVIFMEENEFEQGDHYGEKWSHIVGYRPELIIQLAVQLTNLEQEDWDKTTNFDTTSERLAVRQGNRITKL